MIFLFFVSHFEKGSENLWLIFPINFFSIFLSFALFIQDGGLFHGRNSQYDFMQYHFEIRMNILIMSYKCYENHHDFKIFPVQFNDQHRFPANDRNFISDFVPLSQTPRRNGF